MMSLSDILIHFSQSPIPVDPYIVYLLYIIPMYFMQVLGGAAQELSQPAGSSQSAEHEKPTNKITPVQSQNSPEGWREIVRQRIESKTRRFAKGAQKEVVASKNRFGVVAGGFFYPLMANFDRYMCI